MKENQDANTEEITQEDTINIRPNDPPTFKSKDNIEILNLEKTPSFYSEGQNLKNKLYECNNHEDKDKINNHISKNSEFSFEKLNKKESESIFNKSIGNITDNNKGQGINLDFNQGHVFDKNNFVQINIHKQKDHHQHKNFMNINNTKFNNISNSSNINCNNYSSYCYYPSRVKFHPKILYYDDYVSTYEKEFSDYYKGKEYKIVLTVKNNTLKIRIFKANFFLSSSKVYYENSYTLDDLRHLNILFKNFNSAYEVVKILARIIEKKRINLNENLDKNCFNLLFIYNFDTKLDQNFNNKNKCPNLPEIKQLDNLASPLVNNSNSFDKENINLNSPICYNLYIPFTLIKKEFSKDYILNIICNQLALMQNECHNRFKALEYDNKFLKSKLFEFHNFIFNYFNSKLNENNLNSIDLEYLKKLPKLNTSMNNTDNSDNEPFPQYFGNNFTLFNNINLNNDNNNINNNKINQQFLGRKLQRDHENIQNNNTNIVKEQKKDIKSYNLNIKDSINSINLDGISLNKKAINNINGINFYEFKKNKLFKYPIPNCEKIYEIFRNKNELEFILQHIMEELDIYKKIYQKDKINLQKPSEENINEQFSSDNSKEIFISLEEDQKSNKEKDTKENIKNQTEILLESLKSKIECEKNTNFTISELFDSETDGDKAETFHKKCDHQKNTLTLIETTNNIRFGGFATVSFESPKEWFDKLDGSSFVFSLDNMEIFDIIHKNIPAISCDKNYGPYFRDDQICIVDQFLTNESATGQRGQAYNTRKNYQLNKGKKFFVVKRLQVLKITVK